MPTLTVAAVNGHAFGMGAALALAHDVRVMRRDRRYVCFPEVDLGLSFSPGMLALIKAALPAPTALEAMTTGRRYGGHAAVTAGVARDVAEPADLVIHASRHATAHGRKKPKALGAINHELHRDTVAAFRT